MLKPRLFLLWLACMACTFCLGVFSLTAASRDPARPNLIVIQTDDQGYDDMGFRHPAGSPLRTPTFDRLARESVRFENFYVAPLCAPSRAMVLTGRHHLRTGVWGVHAGQDFIGLDETLIAQPLQAAGYRTGFMGKWHSGKTTGYFPWDRGFDEAYMAKLYVYRDNPLLHNGTAHPVEGWTEERLADLAIDFIDHPSDQPFFLYYCPITAHGGTIRATEGESSERGAQTEAGFHAPEDSIRPYLEAGLTPELAKLYGMLTFLDTQIARIFTALEAEGLADNTVVMMLGDNGPTHQTLNPAEWEARNPSRLKGAKGKVDENGYRSFLFVRQNNRFAPREIGAVTAAVDLFPTLLDLAGLPLPAEGKPLDGLSLAPLLRDQAWAHDERTWYQIEVSGNVGLEPHRLPAVDPTGTTLRPQPLFTLGDPGNRIASVFAARQGDLKLNKGELYNLSTPAGRREEIQSEDSSALTALAAGFSAWWADLVAQPGAFQKPTLVLRDAAETSKTHQADVDHRFYAYQNVAASGVSVKTDNHSVLNFQNRGDTLDYRLACPPATPLTLTLRFRNRLPTGALTLTASLPSSKDSKPLVLQAVSDGSNELNFPAFTLPPLSLTSPGMLRLTIADSKIDKATRLNFIELIFNAAKP